MTDAPKLNAEPPQPQLSAYELEANRFIQGATSMLMNGLRASLPQVPITNLMVKMCSSIGVGVGTVLSVGSLGDIFPMRNACVEAFREGIKSVKIQPPPLQAQQPSRLDS